MNNLFLATIKFLIPLWTANAMLSLLGFLKEKYKIPDMPIDCNKKLIDNKPIIGKSKTFLGLPVAILGGIIGGILVKITWTKGIVFGLSVFIGGVFSGFIKRRFSKNPGDSFWILDQTDYIIGTVICFKIFGINLDYKIVLLSIIITIPVHIITNIIAFKLKLRKYYW